MTKPDYLSNHTAVYLFWFVGALICCWALGLSLFSHRFSYDFLVREMPVFSLVGLLFAGGLIFVLLFFVVHQIEKTSTDGYPLSSLPKPIQILIHPLLLIFLIGLLARLLLLFSEPMLEDDYQRYLWDGGVLAHGENPYRHSPQDVLTGRAGSALEELAQEAAPIPERINHQHLRTIYPIGAELMFGLSHVLAPWSLTGLRLMMLVAEVVGFGLLALCLLQLGRSPFWLSLYWWNPLVIKELINSLHMEALMFPFLVGGFYLALKGRLIASGLLISLAASFKFWPALLLPLIWRHLYDQCSDKKGLLNRSGVVVASIFLSLIIGGAIIWPYLATGLDESSGLLAYGLKWKTNSAFFPQFEQFIHSLFSFLQTLTSGTLFLNGKEPLIARLIIGLVLIGVVFRYVCMPQTAPLTERGQQAKILQQMFVVSLAVFLFSPAQFPWYFVWVAPFLVFYPLWGLVALVPLMSFYYVGFYFHANDLYQNYGYLIAWFIWVPVWCLFIFEYYTKCHASSLFRTDVGKEAKTVHQFKE